MAGNYASAPSKLKLVQTIHNSLATFGLITIQIAQNYNGRLQKLLISIENYMMNVSNTQSISNRISKMVQVSNCVFKSNSRNSGDIQFFNWVEENLMEKEKKKEIHGYSISWNIIFASVVWNLWLCRNGLIFKEHDHSWSYGYMKCFW
ncbi:hypothetical protein LguiB_005474 [Lonicera macranthoides]